MTPQETANHVFARHPKVSEVLITSDGQAFINEDQASGHATRLKDQKIVKVVKGEDAFAKAETTNTTPPAIDLNKVADTKAAVGAPVDPNATAPFEGDDAVATQVLDGNISEVTERLEKVELLTALEHLAQVEKAGQDRKGVYEAIEARKNVIIKTESNE